MDFDFSEKEEAFRKGLIPYIPADRAGEPAEE